MKIKELKENYTTATSVGNIEYTTHNRGKIRLKRRNKNNESEVIANIQRENKRGWRFKPTENWSKHELPHMGHAIDKRLRKRGQKTLEKHLEDTLTELGIKYDSIEKEEAED